MNRVSDTSLKQQVLSEMRLKTDEELIAIWRENDHTEWTDTAFDVVKEVLVERHIPLPEQSTPIQFEDDKLKSSAATMLRKFERKNSWSNFLNFVWIFCLIQVFLLAAGGLLWIGSLIYGGSINFQNLWFPIVFTIIAIPIYFLRKRVRNELKEQRYNLLELIGNGLEQQEKGIS
jgi:hypothetical protein